MAERPVTSEAAAALFRILRDRLSDDPEGRDVLAQFEQDPEDGAEGLAGYLRRRLDADDDFVHALAEAPELPADLRTVVYGGQVERIIHIAQAGTVIVSPPARRMTRLWAGLAALAVVVVVGVTLGWLSLRPTPFPLPQPEPIPDFDGMFISAITQNPKSGDLWISVLAGEMPGGVYRYTHGEGLAFFGQEDGGPHADVLSILGRANGEMWFGTDGAGDIALLAGAETPSTDDDKWRTYTDADGLIGSHVQAVADDRQDNVWFGTLGGLCRLAPEGQWLYYNPQTEKWVEDQPVLPREDQLVVNAIRVDGAGDVWVATSEALLRWPAGKLDSQPIRYRPEDTLDDECRLSTGTLISLAFDQEGRPWVGTDEGAVSVLEAGVATDDDKGDDCWQTYAVAPEVDSAFVLALLPLPDGRVLAGTTGGGLRIYAPGLHLWKPYMGSGRNVTALFLEKEERVWMGTDQGLYHWYLPPTP